MKGKKRNKSLIKARRALMLNTLTYETYIALVRVSLVVRRCYPLDLPKSWVHLLVDVLLSLCVLIRGTILSRM